MGSWEDRFYFIAWRSLGDFTPVVPYLALYLTGQGITVPQVSFLFSFWALVTIIAELPFGILADIVDRKTLLVLSRVSKAGCLCIWLIRPDFIGFLLGFALWGLATALDSGTAQSFLHDYLSVRQQKETFGNRYGEVMAWNFGALFFSAVVASFLVEFGFRILIELSILSIFLSLLALFLIPRAPMLKEEAGSFSSIAKKLPSVLSARRIIPFLVIGILAGGVKGSLEEYLPLILSGGGIALSLVGLAIASFELFKSSGSFVAGRISQFLPRQEFLLLALGILLVLVSTSHSYVLLLFLALVAFVDALLWVRNDASLMENVPDSHRAVISSVKNFGIEAIAFLTFLVAGVTGALPSPLYLLGGALLIGVSLLTPFLSRVRA